MTKPPGILPDWPSLLTTTTSQLPVIAFAGIANVQVIFVDAGTATPVALISACPAFWSFTDAPDLKFFPLRLVIPTVVPDLP